MFAPFLKHLAHILPIFLKPEVLGDEIRDHKDRARGNPDHLNNLVVRVIRPDVVPIEPPSKLEESRVRVTMQSRARHFV